MTQPSRSCSSNSTISVSADRGRPLHSRRRSERRRVRTDQSDSREAPSSGRTTSLGSVPGDRPQTAIPGRADTARALAQCRESLQVGGRSCLRPFQSGDSLVQRSLELLLRHVWVFQLRKGIARKRGALAARRVSSLLGGAIVDRANEKAELRGPKRLALRSGTSLTRRAQETAVPAHQSAHCDLAHGILTFGSVIGHLLRPHLAECASRPRPRFHKAVGELYRVYCSFVYMSTRRCDHRSRYPN